MNHSRDLHEPGFASRQGRKVLRLVGLAIGGVALAVLLALLFGIVVRALWNGLMPGLFGLKTITFWQAFALILLAKILFGGHGHGSPGHDRRFERGGRNSFRKFAESGRASAEGSPNPPFVESWPHFRRYWREEGKEAFEAYLRKMDDGESGPAR